MAQRSTKKLFLLSPIKKKFIICVLYLLSTSYYILFIIVCFFFQFMRVFINEGFVSRTV